MRDMTEKFKILYKFLTDGVDIEDVMYLKRSYEMVSRLVYQYLTDRRLKKVSYPSKTGFIDVVLLYVLLNK